MIGEKPDNIEGLAADVLKRFHPAESLELGFGPVNIRLRSNSPELVAKLKEYFAAFLAPASITAEIQIVALEMEPPKLIGPFTLNKPDPGKNRIKEEYLDLPDGRVVRKRLTGMVFAFGHGLNLALGSCLANDNQVVNFINNRFIQWELERTALLAHAAAVAAGDRGLVLAGISGAGKSTLALHLMSRGLTFVSNDRLLIRADLSMAGVPKLPRINPGTALNNPDLSAVMPDEDQDRFRELDEDDIWTLEQKYDVDVAQCFGPGRFNLFSRFTGLVILNWRRQGPPPSARAVDLADRSDLLNAVRKSPGLFFLDEGRNWDHGPQAYLRRLAGIPVMEITGGADFQRAADLCLDLFDPR